MKLLNHCKECNCPTSMGVMLGGTHFCLDCLYDESIPNPPSRLDPNCDKLREVRTVAINARSAYLIAKHSQVGEAR